VRGGGDEVGIDISEQHPKGLKTYLGREYFVAHGPDAGRIVEIGQRCGLQTPPPPPGQ
jgi:hypothetical protein